MLSEAAKSWINLSHVFRVLRDGSILWWSERSGHGHLYRVRDGHWTALTSGDWEVKDVIALDEDAGTVTFTGNRESPLELHAYVTSLAGGGEAKLLTEAGFGIGGAYGRGALRINDVTVDYYSAAKATIGFQIGAQQNSSLAVVAPGISEALFATAIGLFAAIPAVIAYNRFSHRVDQLEARLQRFADRFHASLSRELEAV